MLIFIFKMIDIVIYLNFNGFTFYHILEKVQAKRFLQCYAMTLVNVTIPDCIDNYLNKTKLN